MRTLLLLLLALTVQDSISQNLLTGNVTDADTGEPIIFGTVAVYQGKVLLTGTETGFSGEYSLELPPGRYRVVFSYTGYQDVAKKEVTILAEKTTVLDAAFVSKTSHGCGGYHYRYPLIRLDDTTQGFRFSAEEIRRSPHRGW